MARARKTAQEPSAAAWWTVGGPCAVVIGMLLLGALLRTSTDGAQTAPSDQESDRPAVDLAARSDGDAARLAAHRDAWTLQFMMACERKNLEPLVEELAPQDNFFLLRYPSNDRECYRVCWGRFASKAEAERPRAYPDILRDVKAIPWATPVQNVLP